MISLRRLLLLAIAAAPLAAAADDDPNYWSLGLSAARYAEKADGGANFDSTGARFKFGRFFGRYLAVEGHLATYLGKSETVSGQRVDARIKWLGGAYVRGNIPFAEGRGHVYALLGYSFVDGASDPGQVVALDGSADGPGAGIGLALFGSPRSGFELEVVRYVYEAEGVGGREFDIDVATLAYVQRF